MSNIDKRALREEAEKAGSDKWQAKKINGDFYVIRNGSYEKQHGITSYQPIAEIEHKPVRDYVAAANPATVLALLDELEAAEKRIALLEAREEALRPVGVMSEKAFHRLERSDARFIALWPRPGIYLPRKRPEDGVIVYARTAGITVKGE
nr:ead/Ea22-like family protein [Escherichia coli]